MFKRGFVVLMLVTAFGLAVSVNVEAQAELDRRVTVSFTASKPGSMFSAVAKMNGLQANIDPALKKLVTLALEDVTLRTLLDAACDSIACRWRIDGNTLVVEALPFDPSRGKTWFMHPKGPAMPAGSQFSNESVASIMDAISRVVGEGATYEVPELDTGQLVTVDVSNQDALRAIAKVVKASGRTPGSPYTVTIRRQGEKPTIIKTAVAREPDEENP